MLFVFRRIFLAHGPPSEEEAAGFLDGFLQGMSSYFSSQRLDPFTSGGICTQSLLAVLKANRAERGWRSLDFESLLRQIGTLLNRQREDAGVSWHNTAQRNTFPILSSDCK